MLISFASFEVRHAVRDAYSHVTWTTPCGYTPFTRVAGIVMLWMFLEYKEPQLVNFVRRKLAFVFVILEGLPPKRRSLLRSSLRVTNDLIHVKKTILHP